MKKISVTKNSSVYFYRSATFAKTIAKNNEKVILFASKKVEDYANGLEKQLTSLGVTVYTYLTSDGEENKNLNKAVLFSQFLALNNVGRKDVIINIGGGTVCDLGAFVASVYMRGIDYINIPTTLLCAVDACVGGKTAIDTDNTKNLWGTFYQPKKVIIDYFLLSKLPNELILEGLSEIVKYAVINKEFENYLSDFNSPCQIKENLQEIIYKCLAIKSEFVRADERDLSLRKQLNLGHTVAHAIEGKSEYKLNHSSAVAMGIVAETKISFECGYISQTRYDSIINLCNKLLPSVNYLNYSNLIPLMQRDKKNQNGKIAFSLPTEQGVNVFYFERAKLEEILKKIEF